MFAQFIRAVLLSAALSSLALKTAQASDRSSCNARAEIIIRNAYPDAHKRDGATFRFGEFDTARYRLTQNQTAFGLRILLRPVLDGLVVSQNAGEWDTNCAGEFQSSESTLSISSNKTHGYADIAVIETKSTKTSFVGKDNDCKDKTVTSEPQTLRLVYDGEQYPIPEDRRAVAE